MYADQLHDAHKRKRPIVHPKGGVYVILGFGLMKHPDEDEWMNACTYMDVKTKQSYTRDTDNFKKFSIKEK